MDDLEGALGKQRAEEIVSKLSALLQIQPFDFLRAVNTSLAAELLQEEPVENLIMLFCYAPAEAGGRLFAALPAKTKVEVAHGLMETRSYDPRDMRRLEDEIEKKLSTALDRREVVGGPNTLVSLLAHTDRATERHLLDSFDRDQPELAETIRKVMFVFEDIVQIDDLDLQKILRDVDNSTLALALKGAPDELMTKIISNMSERHAENLADDIKVLGRRRRSEIEEAQSKIIEVVRRLESEGWITLMRPGEEIID